MCLGIWSIWATDMKNKGMLMCVGGMGCVGGE